MSWTVISWKRRVQFVASASNRLEQPASQRPSSGQAAAKQRPSSGQAVGQQFEPVSGTDVVHSEDEGDHEGVDGVERRDQEHAAAGTGSERAPLSGPQPGSTRDEGWAVQGARVGRPFTRSVTSSVM